MKASRLIIIVISVLINVLLFSHICLAELQKSSRKGSNLQVSFLYMLADFTGVVPMQWARVFFEPKENELYAFTQSNVLRIFNRQGMQIYLYGENHEIGPSADIAVAESGSIFLLPRHFKPPKIQVLDYRGGHQSQIALKEMPDALDEFLPDMIDYLDGKIFLLDSESMMIGIFDLKGHFLQFHDMRPVLEAANEEQNPDKPKNTLVLEISGFSVGLDGSIYLTVPTLFTALRLNPDSSIDFFGASGSGPGKFGVVSGIVSDDKGNIFVADRLRSVVMIFDRDFEFQGEFGYRGSLPEDMIVPDDLAIDSEENLLFVSQAANKGIGVYRFDLE